MSIPLVQNNKKDSINISIIAIKRQIERINALLGLSNSEEIDTSAFATKDELQQAVTDLQPIDEVTADNMQSVTSNAVYQQTQVVDEWSNNGVTVKKVGRLVTVYIYKTLNVASPVTLTTIPARFRPNNFSIYGNTFVSNRSDEPCGQSIIYTNGEVRFYLANGGTFPNADYASQITYMV